LTLDAGLAVRQYQATAESNLIGGSRRKKSSNQPFTWLPHNFGTE